jgi:hypothetical protein
MAAVRAPISANPNAVIGGGSGIAGGLLIVQVFNWFGYDLDAGTGAVIAGVVSLVVLFIGRNGIRGAIRKIWKGAA